MTWAQVLLRRGNAETTRWVPRPVRAGDEVLGWTVAAVYEPAVGACPHCGDRLGHPGSRAHVRVRGTCG